MSTTTPDVRTLVRVNDLGAIVILRATPKGEEPGMKEAEYDVDPIYAQKVKNFGGPEWASLIHELDRDFGFAKILIDLGGGGDFIEPELKKASAKIDGVDTEVVPIV